MDGMDDEEMEDLDIDPEDEGMDDEEEVIPPPSRRKSSGGGTVPGWKMGTKRPSLGKRHSTSGTLKAGRKGD